MRSRLQPSTGWGVLAVWDTEGRSRCCSSPRAPVPLDEPHSVGQGQGPVAFGRRFSAVAAIHRKTLVNAAEPPRILLEGAGSCPSAHRLESLLESSLGPARAPKPGWVVALRLEKTTSRVLRAEGDITDGDGTPVARRVVSGSLSDCDALARAIGVWASLVLDAEASRTPPSDPPPADPKPPAGAPANARASSSLSPSDASATAPATLDSAGGPNSPSAHARDENGPPRAEARAIEIGLGTFLMVGPEGQAIAGATPYAFIEAGHGFFVRPALAVGEGVFVASSGEQLTWAAGRVDACFRVYGLYATNHGLRFGICAGAEGGVTHQWTDGADVTPPSSTTRPFVAVGPSIEMDGDLAGAFALVLRGVAGANLVPDGLSGRIEVALSWRLP
jgi:hypothetical protein